MDNKSFILYASTERQVRMLTDEEAGKLLKAVFAYNRSGEIPSLDPLPMIVFSMIQDYMDENSEKWEQAKEKRVAAGRAGGLAKSSNAKQSQAMLSNANQGQANLAVSVSVSEPVSESVSECVGKSVTQEPAPTPTPEPDNTTKRPRGKYGKAMLTDAELERLKELRPEDWEEKLAYFDGYLARSGKQYNDHLLTIISWAEDDDKKKPAERPPESSVHFELEKKNKGNNGGIFADLFSPEIDDYLKGGSDETD